MAPTDRNSRFRETRLIVPYTPIAGKASPDRRQDADADLRKFGSFAGRGILYAGGGIE